MQITVDEVRRERRKTEELLRQVVRAYLDADQLEDALRLCHSTREWILGEIEDENLNLNGGGRMTYEKAKKRAQQYEKAQIWACPRCNNVIVAVFPDRYSGAWHHFEGSGFHWDRLTLKCNCGSHFELVK